MVERSDLARANALNQESKQIAAALNIIGKNGTITAFTIAVPPSAAIGDDDPSDTGASATVPAAGIVTPPQMITAIQQQLQARYDAIMWQLGQLGVTTAPQPQQQQPYLQPYTGLS